MNAPIRAALDVAARALCFGHDGEGCDTCTAPTSAQCSRHKMHLGDAKAAVLAFLLNLPDMNGLQHATEPTRKIGIRRARLAALAAAVKLVQTEKPR